METINPGVPTGGHYELYADDIYFRAAHPDGTLWVDRIPKVGGTVTSITQLPGSSTFTLANGEVFYEDCLAGTLLARSIIGGAVRPVANGVNNTNACSDQLLVIGSIIVDAQVLPAGSVLLTTPIAGGNLVLAASGLVAPADLVSDGSYLFLREAQSGRIMRFRLPDFSPATLALRSCGGLAIDGTSVYWASEISPDPAPACLDGASGPIVKVSKAP
jgi:hypothetical protein